MARSRSNERNEEPIYFSSKRIEEMYERLARLKKSIPDLAGEAARTAAYGDRSDNAEYKQAKGALRFAHREIFRIENDLKRAVAITPGRNAEETIHLGSVVTLQEENGDGKAMPERTFEILGPQETDPGKGRISDQSPLGKALMKRKKGDIVSIETGVGMRKYLILEVK
jgi:transcription elongation GreA/GreB family factor